MKRLLIGALLLLVCLSFFSFTPPSRLTARAQDSTDYVVATHYPEFGDVEPAPMNAIQASYSVYNNRENDYTAVDRATAEALISEAETETGVEILLLNDWAEVVEDSPALQVVNNVPVAGALYSIFLPPGWTRAAEMPIVLSGNGAGTSNNRRLYSGDLVFLAQISAASVDGAGRGLIIAVSNCGGTESQGVDEVTYRSVGAFLDFLHENGGDKYNVVTAGGSRGGGSGLMWAANLLDLDYNIHTVFAAVPPTQYGTLSQRSILTYPSLASIGTLVSGDPNAWQYDRADNPFRPGTNPSPFLQILLNTASPEEANAQSPLALAERLQGKQIYMSAGAHDAFFQVAHFLEFERRLNELGIRNGAVVTLALGHDASSIWLENTVRHLILLANGLKPPIPTGRLVTIKLPDGSEMRLADFFAANGIDGDPNSLPVTAELPYTAGVGNPIDLSVCGTPGDDILLQLWDENGVAVAELTGTLDEKECLSTQIVADFPVGTYRWSLVANGVEINPRNTTGFDEDGCGVLAVLIVESIQPAPEFTYPPNGDDDTGFGIDEFSGQTCGIE